MQNYMNNSNKYIVLCLLSVSQTFNSFKGDLKKVIPKYELGVKFQNCSISFLRYPNQGTSKFQKQILV